MIQSDDTITVTVISRCSDCEGEITRKQKVYSKKDFMSMAQLYPNYYFTDAGSGEHFISTISICPICQT